MTAFVFFHQLPEAGLVCLLPEVYIRPNPQCWYPSNPAFINALFCSQFRIEEISHCACKSLSLYVCLIHNVPVMMNEASISHFQQSLMNCDADDAVIERERMRKNRVRIKCLLGRFSAQLSFCMNLSVSQLSGRDDLLSPATGLNNLTPHTHKESIC